MSAPAADDCYRLAKSCTLIDNKIRVVLVKKKRPPPLYRKVVAILGDCLQDSPYWNSQTLSTVDRRYLQPCTMRFAAETPQQGVFFVSRQDEIRRSILHAIGQEMAQRGLSGPLPTILIERDRLDSSKANGIIDIHSNNKDVYLFLTNTLHQIEVEQDGNQTLALPLLCFSNSLPADVIPFDLFRLPLTSANSQAIKQSLNTAVAAVGSVTGIGNIEYTERISDKDHGPSSFLRGYIKLHRSSMKLPFSTLATKIPTHFIWESVPYALLYAGREYHTAPLHSADFPLTAETEGASNAGSRLSSPSRSSTISNGQSSTLVEDNTGASKDAGGGK